MAVTPDGRWVLSGSADGKVKVWDLESIGAQRAAPLLRSLDGHTRRVRAVAVTPDGRWAVSGSDDHTVRAWDLESGASRLLFRNDAPILSLAFSPDGRTVVCGDR